MEREGCGSRLRESVHVLAADPTLGLGESDAAAYPCPITAAPQIAPTRTIPIAAILAHLDASSIMEIRQATAIT
jgi:hypothetical protein